MLRKLHLSIPGLCMLPLLLASGCLDRTLDNGMTPLTPPVAIQWPVTGDTLNPGVLEIRYDIQGASGFDRCELYVNDTLQGTFAVPVGGMKPSIVWKVDTSLIGARVKYYIKAYDVDGNATSSSTMTNILVMVSRTPPAAPYNLALWKVSPSMVNLSWFDSSYNETGLEVWRKSGSAPSVMIQRLPPHSISTNDTGLVNGVSYRYVVRAVNAYGFAQSNEVSTGNDITATLAPTNLVATALGTHQVQLQWDDNSTAELGFVIQRRISSGSLYSQIAVTQPNVTVYSDTAGLVGGTSYTYRIAARGQFDQSEWSNEEIVLTLYVDTAPPTNLLAEYQAGPRNVKLSWRSNTIYDSQTRVERRLNTAAFLEIGKVGSTVSTYIDSTVQNGFTYTYRVRVYSVDGHFTLYSNEASIGIPSTTGSSGGLSADEAAILRRNR